MKKLNFLFILVILSACASPQVTEETDCCLPSTLPPATIIPTPTLHPEFIELQNLFSDSSEHLILLPNGQIEENGVVIPNLQVDSNGEISILVEDENIVIDSADITFEDGFHINGYELDENGEWVEAEVIVEYPIITDAYKFRDCVLTVDGTSEKYNQSIIDYVKSLKEYHSTDRVYDAAKLVFTDLINFGDRVFYDPNAPDYVDPETRPYERGAYCLIQYKSPEGKVIDYFASFVQYYVEGLTPEEYPWLVFVSPTKLGIDKNVVDIYTEDMNFPVLIPNPSSMTSDFKGSDPLTNLTFVNVDDMHGKIKQFVEGNPIALDGEQGIIVQTLVRRSDSNNYK